MSTGPPLSSNSSRGKTSPKQRNIFGGKERDLWLESAGRRIDGWLEGCWADGCTWKIWDKHKFHEATKRPIPGRKRQPRILTANYLECVFRVFRRRWAWKYDFERTRIGRSWRWKVILKGAEAGLTLYAVGRRLEGYIKKAVQARGIAHVDGLFLSRFGASSRLPATLIEAAARKLKRIPGLRLRRRGFGAGKKIVASSLPQSSPLQSSLREKREYKPLAASGRSLPSQSSGAPRPPEESGIETADSCPPTRRRSTHCGDPPFQVAGRWISSNHLSGLACVIASGPLRGVHTESCRVCWRFTHTRNFAYRTLRDGYQEDAIIEAWRRGVALSHEDAMTWDRVPGGFEGPPREPSAAVAYALKFLWADKRSREERWREFLEGPRRPRKVVKRVRPADAMPAEKTAAQRTIEADLAARGITLAALMRMNRADSDRIMAEIIARRAPTTATK